MRIPSSVAWVLKERRRFNIRPVLEASWRIGLFALPTKTGSARGFLARTLHILKSCSDVDNQQVTAPSLLVDLATWANLRNDHIQAFYAKENSETADSRRSLAGQVRRRSGSLN
jgi:hypothetical protein